MLYEKLHAALENGTHIFETDIYGIAFGADISSGELGQTVKIFVLQAEVSTFRGNTQIVFQLLQTRLELSQLFLQRRLVRPLLVHTGEEWNTFFTGASPTGL